MSSSSLALRNTTGPSLSRLAASAAYWMGVPVQWGRQFVGNSRDILRVLDLIRFRALGPGLVSLDHPWVTGINPGTGRLIWFENVIYRSPRQAGPDTLARDDVVLLASGRFLATRVRQSAVTPEIALGPRRRMPHAACRMPLITFMDRRTTTAASFC